MVEVLTDNRNRTGAEIRNIFSKNGGSTSEPGAVAWQFDRKGQIIVPRAVDEEEVMLTALDAGAEDIVANEDGTVEVIAAPNDFEAVREALDKAGLKPELAEVTMKPLAETVLTGDDAQKMQKLIDALDDLDDVQQVYTTAALEE
jgi:YebC/PmpR family DNA-binding regulatory protein